MNGQYQIKYRDRTGKHHSDTLGDRDQAIAYALAYDADGFEVLAVTDLTTGKPVNYTGIEYEKSDSARFATIHDDT